MSNTITISYPSGTSVPVKLNYVIEQSEDIQTIVCSIEEKRSPGWLELRKFSMSSLKQKDGYVPLFNEVNNSKNMDTSLFIDAVYTSIMRVERFKIFELANKN